MSLELNNHILLQKNEHWLAENQSHVATLYRLVNTAGSMSPESSFVTRQCTLIIYWRSNPVRLGITFGVLSYINCYSFAKAGTPILLNNISAALLLTPGESLHPFHIE